MADVPGAARLPPPEYRHGAPKALHRRLRQLGGGSLGAGVALVAGSDEEQRQLAAVLGAEPEVSWRWVPVLLGCARCKHAETEAYRALRLLRRPNLLPCSALLGTTCCPALPSLVKLPPLQEVRRDAAHIVQTGL